MMPNVRVQRYTHPMSTGWAGYIEPSDLSWIMFVGLDGAPRIFLHRDPETGAVLPDDAAERAAMLARIRQQ